MTTKFSSFVTGVEKPHVYAHEFMEEPTTGPDRLVIGAHGNLLVCDRHDTIYAYGPLDAFREVLTLYIPGPHAHHYHHDCFADTEDELFRRFDWPWFDLQEGDDD